MLIHENLTFLVFSEQLKNEKFLRNKICSFQRKLQKKLNVKLQIKKNIEFACSLCHSNIDMLTCSTDHTNNLDGQVKAFDLFFYFTLHQHLFFCG